MADILRPKLQDQLTGSLIGLARAITGSTPTLSTYETIIRGLCATLADAGFSHEDVSDQIKAVLAEKNRLVPGCASCPCPCARNQNYDMECLWQEPDEDVRSLKTLLLYGMQGMAAYAGRALSLGRTDPKVNDFLYRGLFFVGWEASAEDLIPMVLECGETNLRSMELAMPAMDREGGNPQLPLTFSPCTQDTVCLLLSQLHLGVKNIRFEPDLPGFLSSRVLNTLMEQ